MVINMKAYGHSREDKRECKFGCFHTKSGLKMNCRKIVDRSNRKTARQLNLKIIKNEIGEENEN